eukprot:CAMPEP_0115621616 /NCGR_PEP_ID=MMETSP0272-20121206/25819_1 /TAXON_ID=71861 /ORGANISM="Scrippsiella trochoidea, Strain CCMP3099" /LENGTH=58 /DNA_ID=CAMNT_0003057743 /DNA_START=76 /DNA_END=249 /DNA_ORIENTATION=-
MGRCVLPLGARGLARRNPTAANAATATATAARATRPHADAFMPKSWGASAALFCRAMA